MANHSSWIVWLYAVKTKPIDTESVNVAESYQKRMPSVWMLSIFYNMIEPTTVKAGYRTTTPYWAARVPEGIPFYRLSTNEERRYELTLTLIRARTALTSSGTKIFGQSAYFQPKTKRVRAANLRHYRCRTVSFLSPDLVHAAFSLWDFS